MLSLLMMSHHGTASFFSKQANAVRRHNGDGDVAANAGSLAGWMASNAAAAAAADDAF